MKHGWIITLVILFLVGCAVQKKNYYVFDRVILPAPKSADNVSEKKKESIDASSSTVSAQITEPVGTTPITEAQPEMSVRGEKKTNGNSAKNKGIGDQSKIEPETDDNTVEPAPGAPPRKAGNALFLLAASLIGLVTFGLVRLRRPANSLTRWAKANPYKSQGLLAAIQFPLMGLGFMNGYNLYKLGYDVSDAAIYGLGATTVISYLSAPLFQNRNIIALPARVNRQRLSFVGIALSSFMLMAGLGNKTDRLFPDTGLTRTVEAVDHAVFANNADQLSPVAASAVATYSDPTSRMVAGGMSAGAAAALIFLLAIVACAGLCLIAFGVAGIGSGQYIGLLGIVLGAILFWLAVRGIRDISRLRRETKAAATQPGG